MSENNNTPEFFHQSESKTAWIILGIACILFISGFGYMKVQKKKLKHENKMLQEKVQTYGEALDKFYPKLGPQTILPGTILSIDKNNKTIKFKSHIQVSPTQKQAPEEITIKYNDQTKFINTIIDPTNFENPYTEKIVTIEEFNDNELISVESINENEDLIYLEEIIASKISKSETTFTTQDIVPPNENETTE